MDDIRENEWKLYFLTIKQWHEVKLRDFQYKINNKILVTNSFLFKIDEIDSEICSYCKEQPEKTHHLFLTCPTVKIFWNELKTWLHANINLEIFLEDREILFSYSGKKELVNYIYVLAKYFIYQGKLFTRNISIYGFISLLKKKKLSEKYICFINGKMGQFFTKWSIVYNHIFPKSDYWVVSFAVPVCVLIILVTTWSRQPSTMSGKIYLCTGISPSGTFVLKYTCSYTVSKIIFSVLHVYTCNLSSLSICQHNCLSPLCTTFRGAVRARLSAYFWCLVNVAMNNLHFHFTLSLTPAFFHSLPPSIV